MQGGSELTHEIPESLTALERQLSAPPGRLLHPLPPQLPHSSAQQISLLDTVCGQSPGDTGKSVGELVGMCVEDFVGGNG